jgi:hydroxyacylglutathione hydrolase
MQVTDHIHALRISFNVPVAPEKRIERVVYSFIILGDKIILIDSGVSGAETMIFNYIKKNGRDPKDVFMLILSHSHPDHLGSAKAIKETTGCIVAAHPGEKHWIEDTEQQFKERPVPGFHTLVGGPVTVDRLLVDEETLDLDGNIKCKVIHTPGHSSGSISLFFEGEKAIFTADSLLLPNDLPIYENIVECVDSLRKLTKIEGIKILLSSWEAPIQGEKIEKRIKDGIMYLRQIHEKVLKARSYGIEDLMELCQHVISEMGLPPFAANPLVAKAFASSLDAQIKNKLFET